MSFYQIGDSVLFKTGDLATLHSYKEGAPPNMLPYEELDLSGVSRIRIDPVSACNARCVFCDADFPNIPVRDLPVEDVKLCLSARNMRTKFVSVGCSYEPLMGKYFEEYPKFFKYLHQDWKVLIATNGILLDQKDITPWVEVGFDH